MAIKYGSGSLCEFFWHQSLMLADSARCFARLRPPDLTNRKCADVPPFSMSNSEQDPDFWVEIWSRLATFCDKMW